MTLRKVSACGWAFTGLMAAILSLVDGVPAAGQLQAGQPPASRVRDHSALPAQAVAEKTQWQFIEARATPEYCAEVSGRGYKVVIEPASPFSKTVRLSHDGHEIYAWTGHAHSVFALRGDVLYYADYVAGRNGCGVVAYDWKSRKRLWRTQLWGIGPRSHSKYSNLVNLAFDGEYLVVYGQESYGRYIELLDPKTGATVGHRLVRKEEKGPAPPPRLNHDDTGRP